MTPLVKTASMYICVCFVIAFAAVVIVSVFVEGRNLVLGPGYRYTMTLRNGLSNFPYVSFRIEKSVVKFHDVVVCSRQESRVTQHTHVRPQSCLHSCFPIT